MTVVCSFQMISLDDQNAACGYEGYYQEKQLEKDLMRWTACIWWGKWRLPLGTKLRTL
jgi:hypothetical protein